MSEYQYHEFAAIDRPLTAREQSELRSLSTRAEQREQEQSATVAGQRHLDTLAVDQMAAWHRVDDLTATKGPYGYDTAVQLLVDLRDIAERGDAATFQQRLTGYRGVHARATSLLERLELVDLDV